MKKIAFLISIVFLLSACSSTKDLSSARAEKREFKKRAEKEMVKTAVEARRFVIKVDRINVYGGGTVYMKPESNFIILNGEIASISLGYLGRTYFSRPISGINLNGKTLEYKMESNETRGIYKIQMVVKAGGDKFDVYLTIGDSGSCNISVNNVNIQSVSYYGTLVPLPVLNSDSPEKTGRI